MTAAGPEPPAGRGAPVLAYDPAPPSAPAVRLAAAARAAAVVGSPCGLAVPMLLADRAGMAATGTFVGGMPVSGWVVLAAMAGALGLAVLAVVRASRPGGRPARATAVAAVCVCLLSWAVYGLIFLTGDESAIAQ